MRSTYCISFACRKAKQDREGLSFITAIIVINGQRATFNLQKKVRPSDFDRLIQSKRTNPIREYCEKVRAGINQTRDRMESLGLEINPQTLRDGFLHGVDERHSYRLSDLKTDYLGVIRKRGLTPGVVKKYIFAIDSLLESVGDKELTTITNADIRIWHDRIRKQYEGATVYGYFTKCKSFFIYAVNDEKIDRNPFNGIKVGRGIKAVKVMSDSDYQKILDRHFDIERCERIRDMFIFACGSGLAWTDCYHLRPEDFVVENGHICVVKKRVKTNIPYYAILLPEAAEIAKKYNYDFKSLQISNQKTNQTLKDIQDSCEIRSVDSLTFHCARHYYINKLVAKGVSPAVVSLCAGHTNFRQSFGYTNLGVNEIMGEVDRHIPLSNHSTLQSVSKHY